MVERAGRLAPGDDYGDLADAIIRGALVGDGSLECAPGELRERYAVGLGSWAAMVGELLGQLGADAGSRRRALGRLRVPADLRRAWRRDVLAAMDTSAAWLASQPSEAVTRIVLAPSVRVHRGDRYDDLARAAGTLALAGDGWLDGARLRPRYMVERAPWLRMVGELLGQVVADAGSVERAATVLAVSLDRLLAWVRGFVSRGSVEAACSRWPVASGDDLDGAAYLDLVEAVERGAVAGDNAIEPPGMRERYVVAFDTWDRMESDLLGQLLDDAGSVRKAAPLLGVSRSTLATWARRVRP